MLLVEISKVARGFLKRRMGASHAVEDITQEILLTVHRARHTYNPARPFTPWFFAISRHKWMDHLRKHGRSVRTEPLTEDFLERHMQESPSETEGLSDALTEAMSVLPSKQKKVVELLKVEGLSIQETSKQMSMSVSSVKVAAHRAYRTLRSKLRGRRGNE